MQEMIGKKIIWTKYMDYRIKLRGFEKMKIEEIVKYSPERYYDTINHRRIAVGKHDELLVLIPYDETEDSIAPVTVHAITRQQINFRLKTGRFTHE
jgi:hypothetical protein